MKGAVLTFGDLSQHISSLCLYGEVEIGGLWTRCMFGIHGSGPYFDGPTPWTWSTEGSIDQRFCPLPLFFFSKSSELALFMTQVELLDSLLKAENSIPFLPRARIQCLC